MHRWANRLMRRDPPARPGGPPCSSSRHPRSGRSWRGSPPRVGVRGALRRLRQPLRRVPRRHHRDPRPVRHRWSGRSSSSWHPVAPPVRAERAPAWRRGSLSPCGPSSTSPTRWPSPGGRSGWPSSACASCVPTGSELSTGHAVVRVLALPLSFVFLGLGLLLIVLRADRRALHDLIAGSAVVYAWDAKAARVRFLARVRDPSLAATPEPGKSRSRRVGLHREIHADSSRGAVRRP